MENLKKNLHFVVFGAGVLLGIIFLGVGMYIRSGTEDSLAAEQASLDGLTKPGAVTTKGTLDQADKRSKRFDASLNTAQKTLIDNVGTAFTSGYKQHADGRQFFSEEANAKMAQLKARYAAMEKPQRALPALLKGWEFGSNSDKSTPWTALDQEMSNPQTEKILEMQMRLRVLDELATTIEKLLESGAGTDFGVKLMEIKFPSPFGPIGASDSDSPWLALDAEFHFECSPTFAILLAEELGNPSQRTLTGTATSETVKTSYKRVGFPIMVEMLQTVMIGRQHEMRFQILNEDKPGVLAAVNEAMAVGEPKLPVPPDPKALDPEKPDGQKLVEEVLRDLNDTDRAVLPVQVGLQFKALAFNKNWRAVKVVDENQ